MNGNYYTNPNTSNIRIRFDHTRMLAFDYVRTELCVDPSEATEHREDKEDHWIREHASQIKP